MESLYIVTDNQQKLALLREKVVKLTKSGAAVDINQVNSNVLGEFLSASNELQQEISKIQIANPTNSALVSYSGQINTVLANCRQNFIVSQQHISALNQYVAWVKGQGVDVTNLVTKSANFNLKAVSLNTAITTAKVANAATSANTATATVSTGAAASTAATANTTSVAPVGTIVPSAESVVTTNVVPVVAN